MANAVFRGFLLLGLEDFNLAATLCLYDKLVKTSYCQALRLRPFNFALGSGGISNNDTLFELLEFSPSNTALGYSTALLFPGIKSSCTSAASSLSTSSGLPFSFD